MLTDHVLVLSLPINYFQEGVYRNVSKQRMKAKNENTRDNKITIVMTNFVGGT